MRKYDSYRDSGVEWIGKIPSYWEVSKFKYHSEIVTGNTPSKIEEDIYYTSKENGFAWVKPSSLDKGFNYVTESEEYLTALGRSQTRIIPKNSIMVCSIGNTLGKLGINGIELSTNQQINSVVCDGHTLIPRFCLFFVSVLTVDLIKWTNFVTLPIFTKSDFENTNMIIPPLSEQNQIVFYLDRKTAQIDSLIEKTQRKIELLKENRTSLIKEAVTKGLNSHVEMKDSGVEWIGEIPSGWKVKKVKYLGNISSGEGIDSKLIEPKGLFPVFGGNGIMGYYSEFNISKPVLAIGRVGEKCGNVHFIKEKVWVNDNSLIFEPNEMVHSLIYIFHTLTLRDLNQLRNKNTQPLITGTLVKNEQIPIPPLSEQYEIVSYLDEHTQLIDKTVTVEERRIELLKAYRQSLISEVVTGKRKVTTDE